MFIVDYLVSNRDRHGMNWGFYYNCDTMKILSCHPLYDHNNSFEDFLVESHYESFKKRAETLGLNVL